MPAAMEVESSANFLFLLSTFPDGFLFFESSFVPFSSLLIPKLEAKNCR